MELSEKISNKKAVVGIIGLGYIGLPLTCVFLSAGFQTIGFDTDGGKVALLNEGKSYIKTQQPEPLKMALKEGRFRATTDFSALGEADALVICVPTPLGPHQEPDLSFIKKTTESIAKTLRKGQLVVLKSTTYPGTTREIMLPVLEATGLKAGRDFHLAYAPERDNPGDRRFGISNTPMVVSGYTERCLALVGALFANVTETVPVSTLETAESAKILENTYRAVNIALVNELKMLFDTMGIDVWEVVEAASTKPFGFQAFYPGPGLGGHCIPIDPFYLTWKAREVGVETKFIELAGQINTYMPHYVLDRTREALNAIARKAPSASRILVAGVAYKPDVDDTRESPALRIIELLLAEGAFIDYIDPFVPSLPKMRKYDFKMSAIEPTEENLKSYDCLVLITDHSDFDYDAFFRFSTAIVDTRNAFGKRGFKGDKIIKA